MFIYNTFLQTYYVGIARAVEFHIINITFKETDQNNEYAAGLRDFIPYAIKKI